MNNVFKEIERMGVYDPLIIYINPNQFYKVGFIMCCNANLKLDNSIFKEGKPIQNPNSHTYWKIKSVSPVIKYSQFQT